MWEIKQLTKLYIPLDHLLIYIHRKETRSTYIKNNGCGDW